MTLEETIKYMEEVAKENDDSAKEFYRISKLETHPDRKYAEGVYVECKKCADEHMQFAEWLRILKKAKFEYDEAWRILTHPTPDVTYADKQMAHVILDKFRNSLGAMK